MSNFFNAIGVADMEKVHSAMIAWILDDKNYSNMPDANTGSSFSTFDLTTRSHLLCDIFGEQKRVFNSIETFVEWNNIDILILTKDQNGEERWVIENKLKSPEHVSNVKGNTPIWQTQKYTQTITNTFKPNTNTFGANGNHYLLLSLTGGSARSTNGNWKSLKYENLRDDLGNILSLKKYHTASLIIREYYNAIDKLCNVLKDFLNNYSNYPIAISSKTKNSEKSKVLLTSKNTDEKYVIENSLETIFQKCLLIEQMSLYQGTCFRLPYTIDETHGNALLDIERGKLEGVVNGCQQKYYVQFEFQNGSFKVQIHQRPQQRNINDFVKEWDTVFKNVANNGWRKKSPTSTPFMSVSFKIDKWWKYNIHDLWNKGFNECNNKLKEEFKTQHGTPLVP